MNRISIRGVGTAAAAVAATALAVGAHVPVANAQEASTHASHASSLTLDLLVTTNNTAITSPVQATGAPAGTSAAELLLLREARAGGFAASSTLSLLSSR